MAPEPASGQKPVFQERHELVSVRRTIRGEPAPCPQRAGRETRSWPSCTRSPTTEDAFWETGKCSGTMYCGDHEHYDYLNEAFGLFAHVNALQRDMCPSATKFEAEIISMTLDLFHAEAVSGLDSRQASSRPEGPGASPTRCSPTASTRSQTRGIDRPNVIKPETAHPAFDKACHLFGIELRRAPVDPVTTRVDVEWVADHIDDRDRLRSSGPPATTDTGRSTRSRRCPISPRERGVGLHVDACLGGFILPFGQELGWPIPVFDFRLPGVTSISADTHKYGYALKGTSVLLFRDKALRNSQYFYLTDWSGGKYCSPGMEGSRSAGLIAATWASMVHLGKCRLSQVRSSRYSTTADQMLEAVRSHPELRVIGDPTFLFSFTSDEFDVYHVNDFMRGLGWRFNGQQYPNALHMAVTRPQTQPGVAEAFAADLDEAVAYAKDHKDDAPKSGAIYGGVIGGMTSEADSFIKAVMADMMDGQQAIPAGI